MSRSTDGHRGRSSTEPTIIALLALLAGLPAAAQEEAPETGCFDEAEEVDTTLSSWWPSEAG